MRLQTKSARASFKAVSDAPVGTFEAIVSVFGNVDLGGDRVIKGAFAKTLSDWEASGDPIPVIWSHEWDDPQSHIGYVIQAEEREEGLYVKALLDVENNDRAAYVARLLKERRVREFSFGYFTRGFEDVKDPEFGNVREITEIDLFEVGPTLLGMNPETVLLQAASAFSLLAKATADEIAEGAFATWTTNDGAMVGRIEHVMTEGVLGVPGSSFQIEATTDNPAVLLRIFDDQDGAWSETEMLVGRRASEVTIIPDPTTGADPSESGQKAAEQKAVSVPGYVSANAERGLKYLDEGYGGDGLVDATIRDARDMASGSVSEEKVRKIGPWIARHLVDFDAPQNSNPDDDNYPGPGLVAHLLWGSGPDAAGARRTMEWAEAEAARLDEEAKSVAVADDSITDSRGASASGDTQGTINDERLMLLLSRPQHMEE